MNYTTIQLKTETREKLGELKSHTRDTYDNLLNALMDLVPSGDDEGKYSPSFKASLLRSLSDHKYGRTHSLDEVKNKLGVIT